MNAHDGRRRLLALAIGSLVAAPLLVAVPARAATTSTVIERGVAFVPKQVDISVGDTVVWSYESSTGNTGHTVTFDNGPDLHSGCTGHLLGCQSPADPTVQRTFPAVGTFAYHCKIHGGAGGQGMAGVVVVSAAGTSTSSTSTTVKATTTTLKATSSTTSTTRVLATSSTLAKSTTTTSDTSSVLLPGEPPPLANDGSNSGASGQPGDSKSGAGSTTVALIVGLLLAVSAGGGYLLWRLRPGRV